MTVRSDRSYPSDKYKWFVHIGGGIGEDVWDDEFVVEAEDIRAALEKAEKILSKSKYYDYEIYGIERED